MDKYYKPGEQIQGYSITQLIGEGRYGIVYLAETYDSKKVVIKQLKPKMLNSTREKLFYEEALLKKLDSPCFPKFIQKFKHSGQEGYILEYIKGRVFEDLLAQDDHHFTKQEIYEVAFKILDLIAILQENNIVHRDIRLPNVIISEDNNLVLIDFGLARYIDNRRYVKEMDYWYLGDFLIYLYYTSYYLNQYKEEHPWYEELDLTPKERLLLQKLMGLKPNYTNIEEIKRDLEELKGNTS